MDPKDEAQGDTSTQFILPQGPDGILKYCVPIRRAFLPITCNYTEVGLESLLVEVPIRSSKENKPSLLHRLQKMLVAHCRVARSILSLCRKISGAPKG
jgi:hypothetical protein